MVTKKKTGRVPASESEKAKVSRKAKSDKKVSTTRKGSAKAKTKTRLKLPDESSKQYYAIEGFCGAGGMSLGLKNAGFALAAAFDLDAAAVTTHCRNLGNKCHMMDARHVTAAMLREIAGLANDDDLALFAGGPPCQGFSKQRRNAHLGDDRNDLVMDFVRIVEELRPRYFMFENVAIFGQKRGRQYLEQLFEEMADYHLYPAFYNSADYGLAQTRERFVIVGRRLDQKGKFHRPTPTTEKWLTIGDVLSGLPEPPDDYTHHPEFPNHQAARVTQPNIHRFSFVPQGGGWQDIPLEYRLECHKDADTSSGGWPDVYGRLKWEGQCPTITGGFDSFTRGRYGHPLRDRPLTPREAARLQGFPDDFVFSGNRGDVRCQIGNAVPPPLAEAIGRQIYHSLLVSDGLINGEIETAPLQRKLF
jgi:DNA (cytosine-5)-methyltransferase 1